MQITGIRCCLKKKAACPGLLTGVILDSAIPFARGGRQKETYTTILLPFVAANQNEPVFALRLVYQTISLHPQLEVI
jgi:hypothetical protein